MNLWYTLADIIQMMKVVDAQINVWFVGYINVQDAVKLDDAMNACTRRAAMILLDIILQFQLLLSTCSVNIFVLRCRIVAIEIHLL